MSSTSKNIDESVVCKEVLKINGEEDHCVIFSIRSSRMYRRHAKENRILLSEYKHCNGRFQPLQHTKNATHHKQYNVGKIFVIPRRI